MSLSCPDPQQIPTPMTRPDVWDRRDIGRERPYLRSVRRPVLLSGPVSHDGCGIADSFVEHGQPVDDSEDWAPPRLSLIRGDNTPEPGVALTPRVGRPSRGLQPFERVMPGGHGTRCAGQPNSDDLIAHPASSTPSPSSDSSPRYPSTFSCRSRQRQDADLSSVCQL